MIKQFRYDDEYLDWYYNKGGMATTFTGGDNISPLRDDIKKAVTPWDPPAGTFYTSNFDPVYSAKVHAWTERASEVWKLLPKTTYLREGDSMKYYADDLAGMAGLIAGEAPFTVITQESAPTVATLTEMFPAIVVDPWTTDFIGRVISTYQNSPKINPAWVKQTHVENLPNQIDKMLTKTIDTVANNGTTTVADFESIDRIISCDTEADGTYCGATDPDLFWGNTSAKIDRDADTGNIFGGGGGSTGPGISLPGSAAARVLSLDYIDDVIAEVVPYSKNNRYIAITGGKTMNELQKLIDPKQRFLESRMDVKITRNGVSTRPGVQGGFSVASMITNGIQIPFFPTRHAANETAANRSATVTDADIGNIWFVDLDAIEFRMAFPLTYLETPLKDMLSMNTITTRHMFLLGGQLISTNFRAMAAVKYLKST